MRRIQMSMAGITAVLSNMFDGLGDADLAVVEGIKKRTIYKNNGTAFTRGKRHASLKSRANRRK